MTLHININDEQQVEALYLAAKHAKAQKLTERQAEAVLLDILRQIRTDDETQADYDRARDQQDWWVS